MKQELQNYFVKGKVEIAEFRHACTLIVSINHTDY